MDDIGDELDYQLAGPNPRTGGYKKSVEKTK
jgi:hypothetical protein